MPSWPSKKPIRVRSLENFPKSAESIDVGLICFEEIKVPDDADLPVLAKGTLLSSLDTASYGQAGDMLLYGNDTGKALLLERDDLRERMSTLESRFQKLEATTEAYQVRTCQLQLDVKRLAAASDGYLKIRARFLDTFKRDIIGTLSTSTIIRTGNAAAHDGDAATDASLYTSRNRTDLPLLNQIYGISYDWIIQLSEADNFDALAVVNCRGTLRANKEIGLQKEVEEAYQLYIMVQMEDPKQSPQEDPLKPLGRAYHKFWNEHRQRSLK